MKIKISLSTFQLKMANFISYLHGKTFNIRKQHLHQSQELVLISFDRDGLFSIEVHLKLVNRPRILLDMLKMCI